MLDVCVHKHRLLGPVRVFRPTNGAEATQHPLLCALRLELSISLKREWVPALLRWGQSFPSRQQDAELRQIRTHLEARASPGDTAAIRYLLKRSLTGEGRCFIEDCKLDHPACHQLDGLYRLVTVRSAPQGLPEERRHLHA